MKKKQEMLKALQRIADHLDDVPELVCATRSLAGQLAEFNALWRNILKAMRLAEEKNHD